MSRRLLVSFRADGTPRPQGSKKAFVVKGRAVMVDDNKPQLKEWRNAVKAAAAAALVAHGIEPKAEGALAVALEFTFERPKSVKRAMPHVAPDLDKLQRSVLDALTTAGVWKDDAQVTTISARKIYGPNPGALVSVYREKE
ncbi:RusA family crossover junction endodeoxyribonuclease [Leucobacter luti]|uniref:RusA family crossover junction endodeoxyribonuclease n=1 Tax=Leucobacter luti TaxID=340320 RepID=UPI003D05C9D4